jgi:hypothetical protein
LRIHALLGSEFTAHLFATALLLFLVLQIIQLSISDSSQPTARSPREIVSGKDPSAIRAYMELRERPVRALTAGSRRIVLRVFMLYGIALAGTG